MQRAVFLAMSVALFLPGCALESEPSDPEDLDSNIVSDLEPRGDNAGSADGAHASTESFSVGNSAVPPPPCPVFPADNWWNTDISSAPVDAKSATYVATIGASTSLHPDFGTQYGIPSVKVAYPIAKSPVAFYYPTESDAGPYPIPFNPPIENGTDAHLLMFNISECKLYELYDTSLLGGLWNAGSGAIWDLTTNFTRPKGWTSADAAGLPIYPGLVRHDEVASGVIKHALRFTAPKTQHGYVFPASHYASSSYDPARPPMGVRFRLKASFDISGYSTSMKVILTALKNYGMFLADNGGAWYLTGTPSPNWNDSAIDTLKQVHGSDFEAVATGPITTN